jgi:SH3-like domain-containing protein
MTFRASMLFVCFALLLALAAAVQAETQTGGTVEAFRPHFAVLRFAEVNLRTGPGKRYPIEWVYRRAGLPVEVTAAFDVWRRIRDWEGSEGWVHKNMLRYQRAVIITGKEQSLRAEPEAKAPVVARLQSGVIAALKQCQKQWCQLESGGAKGWLLKTGFWGIYAEEEIE